jgi:N-acyl-D-amino-acid deacylase
MTSDPASVAGRLDRGSIAPGYEVDLNVIDYDHLTLRAPRASFNLPGGGRRITQRADG